MPDRFTLVACTTLVLLASVAGDALAQPPVPPDTLRRDSLRRDSLILLDPLAITATRSLREVFRTPAPTAVVPLRRLREMRPNTVTDVLRELPGTDVTGVGVQQPRPIIRGQRGQRILLLQDGMRLNNSRREANFGELPALMDPSTVERVEIVRGPASVLYGSDAVGGVINVITRAPEREGLHGSVQYRYGDLEDQHRLAATLYGRFRLLDVQAGVSGRDAGTYVAPSGTFGDIALDDEATVHGTGVEDRSGHLGLGYRPANGHRVFLRAEQYEADDAGFGYVDPADYAPGSPRIDIRYPHQRFRKYTIGWSATDLSNVMADGVEITGWVQDNERDLHFDLEIPTGPGTSASIRTFNFTDLQTLGARAEARKLASERVLLTYGVDFFRDRSENTDSSLVTGFGPPMASGRENTPNAMYRSAGAFLQAEVTATPRLTVIVGGRFQEVRAETRATPDLDETFESKSARAVVGAANALYSISDEVVLVGSIGTAFRVPNLIEWFFDGPTPEGDGYQVRTPGLEPERSVNIDVGARYRGPRAALELFLFRNHVNDGIRIEPLGTQVNGLDAFRNVNVEDLVFRGIEAAAEVSLPYDLVASGSFSLLDTEDQLDPDNPVGDSFSRKVTGGLRYQHPSDRFWIEYTVRHNSERDDVQLGSNPVGDALPAFTVHGARAGVTILQRAGLTHRLGLQVHNLTNELYAEASNVSFFRPEPRRGLTLLYEFAW